MRIVIALGGNALLRRGEPMTTIQQELRSLLPPETQVATLLTMAELDPGDPAFASPSKFVGPVYGKTVVAHTSAADAESGSMTGS